MKFLGHTSSTTLPYHYKSDMTPFIESIDPDDHHNTHRIVNDPITINDAKELERNIDYLITTNDESFEKPFKKI